MNLKDPFYITSRLTAGLKVAGAEIGIEFDKTVEHGRSQWKFYIDIPGAKTYESNTLSTGSPNTPEALQSAFGDLLTFLSDSEDSEGFNKEVRAWASRNETEITCAQLDLEETKGLIS